MFVMSGSAANTHGPAGGVAQCNPTNSARRSTNILSGAAVSITASAVHRCLDQSAEQAERRSRCVDQVRHPGSLAGVFESSRRGGAADERDIAPPIPTLAGGNPPANLSLLRTAVSVLRSSGSTPVLFQQMPRDSAA
jgi:hypothetical protein